MNKNKVKETIYALLAAIIWGTAFVAQDVCADKIDPFFFNAVRAIIAVVFLSIVLLVISFFKKSKEKRDTKKLILGGIFCGIFLTIATNLQQVGITMGTSGGKAGFITALYVVLVPIASALLGHKAPLTRWIAVVLSVIALYLLCINGAFKIEKGDFFVLLCALFFTCHIMSVNYFTGFVDGIELSAVQFLVTAVLSLILSLVFGKPTLNSIRVSFWPVLYVGIFSSGIAYTLQILAEKEGDNPTVVTILLSLESVFALISSAIILHKGLATKEYVGAAIMLIAVILSEIEIPKKNRKIRKL